MPASSLAVARAVVHAEAAADVEVASSAMPRFDELGVDLRDLLGRLLEHLDVRDLAAEMEMQQHELRLLAAASSS